MNSSTQTKSMLQTKSVCFGKDFRQPIPETVKARKQYMVLVASTAFKDAHVVTQSFRRDPKQNQNKLSGGGMFYHSSKRSSAISTTVTVGNGIAYAKIKT